MQIQKQQGSATSAQPSAQHGVIIAHLCNHVGAWGAGFVLAVNDLSLAPHNAYRAWCKAHDDEAPLGETQFVEIKPNLFVANMIAQNGIDKSIAPDGNLVDYKALNECLKTVFRRAVLLGCHVHIPSGIGSGLAGGDAQMIHDIISTRADNTEIQLLEQQMKFAPIVTLWEFTDTSAKSYVKPASKQSMVDSVFGSPDNTDDDASDAVLDEILDDIEL